MARKRHDLDQWAAVAWQNNRAVMRGGYVLSVKEIAPGQWRGRVRHRPSGTTIEVGTIYTRETAKLMTAAAAVDDRRARHAVSGSG